MEKFLKESEVISKEMLKSFNLELSRIVGHDILILSDQFENHPLYAKVVLVNENIISIDRGGADGKIDKLLNEHPIIVQFDYKGQRLSVKATVYRTAGGRCNIALGETIIPLSRRMFKRYNKSHSVKCAILPQQHLYQSKISKLRWMELHSLNISGGGILLPMPTYLSNTTFLLMNIDVNKFDFPDLVIGQIRYTHPTDSFHYNVGVQFIVAEQREKYFKPLTIKKMPSKIFEYTIKKRNDFDKALSVTLLEEQE